MKPSIKLTIGGLVVAGVTVYMAYVGAAASWQYYLTVDECAANAAKFVGSRVRVSGKIAADSLAITADRRQATFKLQGQTGKFDVRCQGLLPENLAEDMDVVVEGRLERADLLRGEKVLTRCASKYAPRDNATASEQPLTAHPKGST